MTSSVPEIPQFQVIRESSFQIDSIFGPITSELAQVEDELKIACDQSEGILRDSSRYVLLSGGKRLRAALVLFCALTAPKFRTRKSMANSAVKAAVAVELIHAATLVHDDLIDRGVIRRLKPAVNIEFGEDVAVLLGDYLYAKAFHYLAQIRDEQIISWIAESAKEMCEGELDQLKHRYDANLTLEQYFSFIERKTASLIAASARVGAHLARLPKTKIDQLYRFGLNIGIAFQIIDDLLDIVGSEKKIGKTLRADTGNGKLTLPTILLLKETSVHEKNEFLRNFWSMNPDWDFIQALLKKYNILKKTEVYADEQINKAIRMLDFLDSGTQKSLSFLSHFILKRDY